MSNGLKRPTRLGAVALSLALFASACGGTASEEAAPTTDTGTTEADTNTDSAAGGIPELIGTTVSGAQLDTNDLAGQDVAIWFWAPW